MTADTPRATPLDLESAQRLIGAILLRGRLRPLGLALVWRMASTAERLTLTRAGFGPEPIALEDVEDLLEELIRDAVEEPAEAQGALGLGDLDVILEGLDTEDERYRLLEAMRDRLIAESRCGTGP